MFRLYTIPAGSMLPALPVGSYILASRASYGYSRYSFESFALPIAGRWPAWLPQRGDVIVFLLARDRRTLYVKRVVGLPGDHIQMIKGRLAINGRIVPIEAAGTAADHVGGKQDVPVYRETLPGSSSYLIIKGDGDARPFDNTPEFVVPPDNLFVLGDNRDNSTDSRAQSERFGIGYVPVELVIGRVVATFGGWGP